MPKLVITDRDRTWLVDLHDEDAVVVGRTADCDVCVGAERASRRHCTLEPREDGGHALRDLGSTNGTTLNGVPVAGTMPVADGDVVDAGGCRIAYRSRP